MVTPRKTRVLATCAPNGEQLHPVPSQPGYFATRDGRVYSHRRPELKEIGDCPGPYGHRSVNMNGTATQVHRVIYETFIAPIPDGMEVDHINRNPSDNRPENLRLATRQENARNNSGHKKSTSRHPGVTFHKRFQRWQAHIRIDGKLKHLGVFNTEAEAVAARREAASIHFGEFAPV